VSTITSTVPNTEAELVEEDPLSVSGSGLSKAF
jgi:hypothetical protein